PPRQGERRVVVERAEVQVHIGLVVGLVVPVDLHPTDSQRGNDALDALTGQVRYGVASHLGLSLRWLRTRGRSWVGAPEIAGLTGGGGSAGAGVARCSPTA